jgi:WD40 repeat protein/DNA-binding SARP family transcriptional activator
MPEAALEFALLGPVEARRDGRSLPVGGLRQRALLAILLLHAGKVVSSDRLIDALFGERPPSGAANALQQAVFRLRRTLGDPKLLATRAPGYVLEIERRQLDLGCFEQLYQEARDASARGDPANAAEHLRAALALWRGTALADVVELDFGLAESRRLEELRLGAVLDRIDAELALGEASSVVAELEEIAAANPFQERPIGQLMLALYRSGRQADALQVFRDARGRFSDELGLDPSRSLLQLERAILTQDASLDPGAQDRDVAVCPFKGLASFDVADSRFFCGRERVVDDLVTRLAERPLVGVVGPSGVGKSSVLRAGLLRALASGALPGSESWTSVLIRPGAHPGGELERALGAVNSADATVVAVDQFEELFTVCTDERERMRFVETLVAAVSNSRRRVLVALALRADFYGRCATYPELARLLSSSHVLVGPMQTDELRRAIVVPSERAGLHVEDELVATLIDDVAGEPGGLPLLSTALLELWRNRDDSTLRLHDYRQAGGVHGAVGRLAESTYGGFDDDGKQVARWLTLRLAAGDADNAVRRRVPAAELTRGSDEAAKVLAELVDARLLTADDGSVEVAHEALLREWPRMREWLEEERESRRLEAHVRSSAREWDERGRDPGDLYRGARLSAVLDWRAGHAGELDPIEHEFIEAGRLEGRRELESQRRRNRRLRTLAGAIFVLLVLALVAGGAALLQRGTARQAARDALAKQLGAEALTAPRIDQGMLLAREAVALSPSRQTDGTLLATLLRAPAAIETFASPIDSRPQRLSITPDQRTLAVVDNTASTRFYDPETRRLRGAVSNLGHGTPLSFTPDGSRFIAFAGVNHPELELGDTRTLKRLRLFEFDNRFKFQTVPICGDVIPAIASNRVAFAYCVSRRDGSDGQTFVDAWDLGTGRRTVTARPVPLNGANVLQTLRSGRLLLLGDSAALILDPRTLRVVERFNLRPIAGGSRQTGGHAQVVSPDGRTVAAGGLDGTVRLVDLPSGRVRLAGSHAAVVQGMAFSPNGRLLATGDQNGVVIVWDVRTGAALDRFNGHATRILGLAFGADNRTLYSCSLDGAIFVWDLGTSRRFGRPFGAPSTATPPQGPDQDTVTPPLAISPDGRRFAVRTGQTSVTLYDTATAMPRTTFSVNVGGAVLALAWGVHGRLAVSGYRGQVQLWDVSSRPQLARRLRGLGSTNGQLESITALAFSPDGSLLAAGDVNHTPSNVPWRYGTAVVWNISTGRLLWKVRSKRGWINTVRFSPDGATLATANESGDVGLYGARTGRPGPTFHVQGNGYVSEAFTPDGTTLATGTWDGIVQLWNTRTGRELGNRTLVAAAPVSSIDFDPSGSTFATSGGSDGIARLWTTDTLQQFGSNLPGGSAYWGNAIFTPDGTRLVVAWGNGAGEVWPTTVAAWERHACAVAGRNFSLFEWRQLVGGAYRTTCPGQPTVSGP